METKTILGQLYKKDEFKVARLKILEANKLRLQKEIGVVLSDREVNRAKEIRNAEISGVDADTIKKGLFTESQIKAIETLKN